MGVIYGDTLGREDYINTVVSVVKDCTKKSKPTTFAIEGKWGQGKTWLINKIEAKLKNVDISRDYTKEQYEKSKSEYFIIHYNAWEKDYYEEPLLSILSTIVNELNKQLCVNNALKTVALDLGKEVLAQLETVLSAVSKKLLHFDLVDFTKNTAKGIKKLREKSKIILRTKNPNNDIENDIKNVISILSKLSKSVPIVFIVDELDRCIPNFAIKTLERLHHIFDNIPNSVTILAIHKEQLSRSIDKLYGKDASSQYLKKFIDFKIILNEGNLDEEETYKKLTIFSNKFSKIAKETHGKLLVNEIISLLLPREFENILDRALLCHDLVGIDTSDLPYECMLAEIIIQTFWVIAEKEGNTFNVSPENGNTPNTNVGKAIKEYFTKHINQNVSLEGDGVVACVVSLVLGYKFNHTILVDDTVELYQKLTVFYDKYKLYFKAIRTV